MEAKCQENPIWGKILSTGQWLDRLWVGAKKGAPQRNLIPWGADRVGYFDGNTTCTGLIYPVTVVPTSPSTLSMAAILAGPLYVAGLSQTGRCARGRDPEGAGCGNYRDIGDRKARWRLYSGSSQESGSRKTPSLPWSKFHGGLGVFGGYPG